MEQICTEFKQHLWGTVSYISQGILRQMATKMFFFSPEMCSDLSCREAEKCKKKKKQLSHSWDKTFLSCIVCGTIWDVATCQITMRGCFFFFHDICHSESPSFKVNHTKTCQEHVWIISHLKIKRNEEEMILCMQKNQKKKVFTTMNILFAGFVALFTWQISTFPSLL